MALDGRLVDTSYGTKKKKEHFENGIRWSFRWHFIWTGNIKIC